MMQHPTFTDPAPVLDDPFGIGQRAVARNAATIAREHMHLTAPRAFATLADFSQGYGGLARDEALRTIHYFAAQERKALAVLRRVK